MIRLGLRLTFGGGREGLARLVITALATALGVAMLFGTVAVLHAVRAQNGRYAWMFSSGDAHPRAGVDPVWWAVSGDDYRGRLIGRVDVAATGPRSPVPPGVPRLPGPGEYYASPALQRLLRRTPRAELGERFPGRLVGTIGAAGLPSRDLLVALIGHAPAQLARDPRAGQVTRIDRANPNSCKSTCTAVGIDSDGLALILAVAAGALLFPVLVFVGAASRLSSARREQRFAAMRLVGATPGQITTVSVVESAVAAVFGVALGLTAFLALRTPLAGVPFTGAPFYPSDLSLRALDVAVISVGVPIAAAVAATVALRRVAMSPLGVSRRVTPPTPRAWRVLPLVLGLAELAWFVHAGRPPSTGGQIAAYLSGFLITMAGVVLAGPWLTAVAARLLAARSRRTSALIAGRRLQDDPRAGFRASSGLVLALFVMAVAVAIMGTIRAYEDTPVSSALARGTLVQQFTSFDRGVFRSTGPGVPAALVREVRAVPGVRGVTLVHDDPQNPRPDPYFGLVSCAELRGTPALGRCPAGTHVARVAVGLTRREMDGRSPLVPVATPGIDALPVQAVVVDARGSARAIERARTILERPFGGRYAAQTLAELTSTWNPNVRRLEQYQQLADAVVLASLLIAGCSVAVSVTAGIETRRRPFSLLRLSGAPLSVVRRAVLLECGLPLVCVATISTGLALAASALFVRSQLHETLQLPGSGFWLAAAGGLLASLAVVACTLPMLERLTGPETARNG